MHDSRKTGLLRLKHLREHTEAVGERFAEERQRFERLAGNDAAPRVISAFNLFQTPEPLAAQAVAMLGPSGRTLEPSAGLGRLYRALRAIDCGCDVVLVEMAAECAAELYRTTETDERCRLVQADFLTCDADRLGTFDRIIMNPPFKMGRDVKHITHARTLLRPGGRLVSFCANGPRQREALRPIADEWRELPAKAFASEGTNVNAVLLAINA